MSIAVLVFTNVPWRGGGGSSLQLPKGAHMTCLDPNAMEVQNILCHKMKHIYTDHTDFLPLFLGLVRLIFSFMRDLL